MSVSGRVAICIVGLCRLPLRWRFGALPAITFLSALLCSPAALAVGAMAWTAQLTSTGGGGPYTTTQSYPTKAQAIAAVIALWPYGFPTRAQLQADLTSEKAISVSPSAVTFQESAPQEPINFGSWTYVWGENFSPPNQTYTSEEAAAAPGCVQGGICSFTISPTDSWQPYSGFGVAPIRPDRLRVAEGCG